MKANVKGAIEKAKAPHVAFVKHNLRAEVDKRIQEHIDKYEAERVKELEAYARVMDETMIYALHKELGWGVKRIRKFWDAMYRTRLDARIFFRDGSSAYKEQETGKNIEDLGIRAELKKIGIDMDEWLAEKIELTEEQAAALNPKKEESA